MLPMETKPVAHENSKIKKKMVAKLLSGLTPLKIVVTTFHKCILLTLLCSLDCNVFQVL